jgi:hypothetical protein
MRENGKLADQTIQYTEEMVGAGHGTKADTLNRHALVEHENDGTHIYVTVADSAPATPVAKRLYEDTIIKVWLHWTYSAGTPSINDDVNVSGIVDTATGSIAVTFATAMANTTYAVLSCGDHSNGGFISVTSRAVGSVQVLIWTAASTASDSNGSIAIVGNN